MTLLIIALFAVAALLAVGSLAITIRNYAGAALAVGRQLEACSGPVSAAHRANPVYRRRKAQLTCRSAIQRGMTARSLRRERIISAQQGGGVHKIGRRRQFGLGIASPGTLVPGTLVFE